MKRLRRLREVEDRGGADRDFVPSSAAGRAVSAAPRPPVETPIDAISAPVEAPFDAISAPVEVAIDAVAQPVQASLDAVAAPIQAVVLRVRVAGGCGRRRECEQ